MKLPRLSPDKAYIGASLFLPLSKVSEGPIRGALTFGLGKDNEPRILVKNHPAHLEVPRGFLTPQQLKEDLGIEVVDLRPQQFPRSSLRPKPGFALRDRQLEPWAAFKDSKGSVLHLPCGAGKTVMGLYKAAHEGLATLIVSPQAAHLDNWLAEMQQFFDLDTEPGRVGDGKMEYDREVVLCTVQTLATRAEDGKLPIDFAHRFGTIIFDECFPAGTMIGSVPIEQIQVGDTVPSYDEGTGSLRTSVVTHVFKREASEFVRVRTGAREVLCTPNHPFLTLRGWVAAEELTTLDFVRVTRGSENLQDLRGCHGSKKLQNPVRALPINVVPDAKFQKKSGGKTVRSVRYTGDLSRTRRSFRCTPRQSLLFGGAQNVLPAKMQIRNYGSHKCNSRIFSYGEQQPHAPLRSAHEGLQLFAFDGVVSSCARWERQRLDGAPKTPCGCAGVGYRDGYSNRKKCKKEQGSLALHAGHSKYRPEDCNRSGRGLSQCSARKKSRSGKGGLLDWARVESLEIFKQRGSFKPGELPGRCTVYNLEVADTHTYVANGYVVHNCHHMSAEWFARSIDLCIGNRYGLTATPKRTDRNEGVFLSHIGPIVYSDDTQEMIPEIEVIELDTALTDADEKVVQDRSKQRNLAMLKSWLAQNTERNAAISRRLTKAIADGRTIYALSHSVEHVKTLSAMFPGSGLITGETPSAERLVELNKSKIVFATFGVATENYNRKDLDCLFILTPLAADGYAEAPQLRQAIGRVQRAAQGKKTPEVIIFLDRNIDECKGLTYSVLNYLKSKNYPFRNSTWNQKRRNPLGRT